ncbi:MAG: biopolymer transporter ExbD [Proteobacteria bacterium]|nr:biopolymer transporter ExbD [Pseudomonadota bacterium]
MKFFTNKERALSIEITPFIVFLLVIFFVVTSKIETNQYLSLDLPTSQSFSSNLTNADQNIILLDSGTLVINNQEFDISQIEEVMVGIQASFETSETIILSIENKAYHEWVILLMDQLQGAGFQNLQIKTYTD